MKETINPFNSNQQHFVTMVQVTDPGLRLDLMHYVEKESLCIKHKIISNSREIKMNDFGMSEIQLETVVLLVNKSCLVRLREILYKFDLLEKETTLYEEIKEMRLSWPEHR